MFTLLELGLIILVFATVITQIIIPVAQQKKLFPIFREENKLKADLVDLNQVEAVVELRNEVIARSEVVEEKVEVIDAAAEKLAKNRACRAKSRANLKAKRLAAEAVEVTK